MAPTLNFFTGGETGGLEETSAVVGSPTVLAAAAQSGSFGYRLVDSGTNERIVFTPFSDIADAGADYIVGFRFRTNDTTPATNGEIFRARQSDPGSSFFTLDLMSNGNLVLKDANLVTIRTIVNPFTVNVYHHIEVFFQHVESGTIEVFIDTISQGEDTAQDLSDATTFDELWFENGSGDSGVNFDLDDIYLLSGAIEGNRLNDFAVKAYQNTVEDTTDQGDPLATGTWANVGETPAVEANDASYVDTGNLTGSTICDEGASPGPAGDTDITVRGVTILAAKWIYRLKRTAGAGRVHSMLTGNDGGGFPHATTTVTLEVTYGTFVRMIAAPAAEIPTASENFQHGFSKSATGGRDILCSEIWAMLAYIPVEHPPISRSIISQP